MTTYVCNPKTGRVIQFGGVRYKQITHTPYWRQKLSKSPKSSSKGKLKPLCKKRKSPKRRTPKRRTPKRRTPKRRTQMCRAWMEDLCETGGCPPGMVCGDKRQCVNINGKRWEESGCRNPSAHVYGSHARRAAAQTAKTEAQTPSSYFHMH